MCPLLRADLQRCGAAGTIIGLLLDVNLFWEVRGDSMLGGRYRPPQDEEQQARRMSSELSYSFADASGPVAADQLCLPLCMQYENRETLLQQQAAAGPA